MEKTDYKCAFAERLNSLIKFNSLTLDTISMETGISKSSISRYMDGTRNVSIEFLIKIADCLGVSVDYLLGRTQARKMNITKDELDNIIISK